MSVVADKVRGGRLHHSLSHCSADALKWAKHHCNETQTLTVDLLTELAWFPVSQHLRLMTFAGHLPAQAQLCWTAQLP